ncbi:MAG: hypothetical protein ACK5PB_12535 [Pirellula sp.]|jgi:hypothetical protein
MSDVPITHLVSADGKRSEGRSVPEDSLLISVVMPFVKFYEHFVVVNQLTHIKEC